MFCFDEKHVYVQTICSNATTKTVGTLPFFSRQRGNKGWTEHNKMQGGIFFKERCTNDSLNILI